MLLTKKSGFTLIELMVVIVIIGVLASLAIPRFTEASAKAKIAEAPRIIASYESAFLAYRAENGINPTAATDLIFVADSSKWFYYDSKVSSIEATAKSDMGKFIKTKKLTSTYEAPGASKDGDCFMRSAGSSADSAIAHKMIPNYFTGACVKGS